MAIFHFFGENFQNFTTALNWCFRVILTSLNEISAQITPKTPIWDILEILNFSIFLAFFWKIGHFGQKCAFFHFFCKIFKKIFKKKFFSIFSKNAFGGLFRSYFTFLAYVVKKIFFGQNFESSLQPCIDVLEWFWPL